MMVWPSPLAPVLYQNERPSGALGFGGSFPVYPFFVVLVDVLAERQGRSSRQVVHGVRSCTVLPH
jgi:hypothetical protein